MSAKFKRLARVSNFYHGGQISVDRLSALSDGFIAIIITLMVLEIPVPKNLANSAEIWELVRSVGIYFASFIVVGLHWNRHHYILDKVEKVSNSFIWKNLIFLFSLSLIPFLMKWMIQNPDATIPAMTYAMAYIFTEFCMRWIHLSAKGRRAGFFHRMETGAKKAHLQRLVVNFITVVVALSLSFFAPQVQIFLLVLIPVLLSLSNIFANEEDYIQE